MKGACVWLTGPPGAGKSTIAEAVVTQLRRRGRSAAVVDDPEARTHLATEHPVDALIWLARVLVDGGAVLVVATDLPQRSARERVRGEVPGFVEIFVDGGVRDDGYEEPFAPELRVPTRDRASSASAAQVISWLEDAGIVPHDPAHPADH